jgi:hypothetical protein
MSRMVCHSVANDISIDDTNRREFCFRSFTGTQYRTKATGYSAYTTHFGLEFGLLQLNGVASSEYW